MDDQALTADPWQVADELVDLCEWDPEQTTELPGEALSDPEWVRKRLIALRFARKELEAVAEAFDAEQVAVEDAIHDMFGDEINRLNARRNQIQGGLAQTATTLEQQLVQYHRAVIANAKRRGQKVQPSLEFPHGTLRSKAPSVKATVQVVDEKAAVAWLESLDDKDVKGGVGEDYIKTKPATRSLDKVAARALILEGADGKVIGAGIRNDETGEVTWMPGVEVAINDRSYSIDTD